MPYISPKSQGASAVPGTPPALTQRASSSVTPTFSKAIFEPTTNKSSLYSPDTKTSPTTPRPLSEFGDIVTPKDETTVTTPVSVDADVRRLSWIKRKPVPGLIVLPNETVPASHPFAKSVSSAKPSPLEELAPPPLSPRHGPLPPRRQGAHSRNVSLNRRDSPRSPTESEMSDRPGLFWAPQPTESTKPGGGMEVLNGDEDGDVAKGKAGSEDTEPTIAAGGGPKRTDSSPYHISRSSSSISHLTAPSTGNHKGSLPLAANAPAASSLSPSPQPQQANTINGGQHPLLRMMFDKSLPALPLDRENGSPSRPAHARHLPTGSTSSDPSTQVVTPRTVSQPFGARSPDQYNRDEAQSRPQWHKRIGALTRTKTSKAKPKATAQSDVTAIADGPGTEGAPEEDETFSVDRIPSKRILWEAGTLFLTDENGDLVCFGDMFPKMPDPVEPGQPIPPIPKTAVFFIRHFWCGQCQDFMFASLSQLDPDALEKAGIKVIIISNGSWKIIKSYKELFKCPFPIYVDGPRKLYQLMGMTKMTNDFGPMFKGRAAYHQRSVPRQFLQGGKNALTKMPLANPGKLTQLGGEFVLSPGYNCDFAHRMTNTSNHMEAPDVLREAGCPHPTRSEVQEITFAENQKAEFDRLEKEMREWRAQRETELERIRRRRAERRGEAYNPMANTSRMALGLENDESEPVSAAQAQADVSLFGDAPSSRASTPSPTRPQGPDSIKNGLSGANGDDGTTIDGPVCLPIESMEDVLAWEPEPNSEPVELEKGDRRMDEKFTTAMRELGISLGPEIATPVTATNGDAVGQKASGTGNGLDVTH